MDSTYTVSTPPARKLKTNKSLVKLILLSIITFGIYPIVVYTAIGNEINLVATRYDGKSTMHFCLLCFLVGPVTCGIADIVWLHRISNRIGAELARRGVNYNFSANDFWLWGVLGSLLCGIGPFVYMHKLCKAVNLMNEDYNVNG